jgi:hypothetical protein
MPKPSSSRRRSVCSGPLQLAAPHLRPGLHPVSEAPLPRARTRIGQAVAKQQLQMCVVRLEHAVVQRLLIHRMRSAAQQQLGQLWFGHVPGLAPRTLLAFPEDAGERGERRGQTLPQKAGVRIGSGIQKRCRTSQHIGNRAARPAVAQIQQRLPAHRAAPHRGRGGVAGAMRLQGYRIGGRRRSPDMHAGQPGVAAQHPGGRSEARWSITVVVVQHRQVAEVICGAQVFRRGHQ